MFLALLICVITHAKEKTPTKLGIPLDLQTSTQTEKQTIKKSTVSINGQKFQQIEAENNFYYIRLRSVQDYSLSESADCVSIDPSRAKESLPLITTEIKIFEWDHFFIEGLQTKCQKLAGQNSLDFLKLGIVHHNPRNGTEKRIFINPFMRFLGVGGIF